MKTQEQKFLDWCKEHKVTPKKVKRVFKVSDLDVKPGEEQFHMHYHVEPYVKVIFAGKVMKRAEKWVIYFDSVGRWFGGSNLLWDASLPWMK